MCRAVIIAFFSLFVLSPFLAPRIAQALVAPDSEVRVSNFPETQQVQGNVHVDNFPDVLEVRGSVSVEGTTKSIAKEHVVVPMADRGDLSEMIYAGTIETDGFTSVLISMEGEMRSDVISPGSIGVLLVPDEAPIIGALRDARRVQFPIECAVRTKKGASSYFAAEQVRRPIAFPRYRMYLYNTTNKSADANVYLYLSNAPVPGVHAGPGE